MASWLASFSLRRGRGGALMILMGASGCSLVVGDLPGPQPDAGTPGATSGSGGAHAETDARSNEAGSTGAAGATSMQDAAQDATVDASPGDGGANPCDRDGDHDISEECGGGDCDDDDRDVHLHQDQFFDHPNAKVGFDYNCDGRTDRQYPQGLNCSVEMALCNAQSQGFLDDPMPACGDDGSWGHCNAHVVAGLPTTCESQLDEMRRVACH